MNHPVVMLLNQRFSLQNDSGVNHTFGVSVEVIEGVLIAEQI